MAALLIRWLHEVAVISVFASVTLLVLVNGAFAAGVFVRRDRRFVNRWTGRVLAMDLALIGVASGVPILAAGARFAARTFAPSIHAELRAPGLYAPPLPAPPTSPGATQAPVQRSAP